MQPLKHYLEKHPFFKGIKLHHLENILGCATDVRFDVGQYILREGEEANSFYIILSGKVTLEIFTQDRGPIILQTMGEGDVIGWSWLIPPYNWRFDAKAIETTQAVALDGKSLRVKCEEDHDLGYEMLKRLTQIIASRLEATRLQLLDVYGIH